MDLGLWSNRAPTRLEVTRKEPEETPRTNENPGCKDRVVSGVEACKVKLI